jgi:hypothetical protein
MTSDEEWAHFSARAVAALKRGAETDVRGAQHLFQVAVLPSFEVAASWSVFATQLPRDSSRHLLLTTWDLPRDAAKFESPVERIKHPASLAPTMRTTRFELSSEQVARWQARLAASAVPALPGDHAFGADGVQYRLAAGSFFATSVFEWWEEGPPAWHALISAVREILSELEQIAPRTAV